jgi:hypothetical protein
MDLGDVPMGCGGICEKFNDGVCMGACSMDGAGRENYVKVLEERAEKKAAMQSLASHSVVLKPINPAAHAFLNEPKIKSSMNNQESKLAPLTSEDTRELFRMKL